MGELYIKDSGQVDEVLERAVKISEVMVQCYKTIKTASEELQDIMEKMDWMHISVGFTFEKVDE